MSHYAPLDTAREPSPTGHASVYPDQRASVYSTDVNDFYDGNAIPAPHRLTGNYPSPLGTPTQSYADIPRTQSVGSMSHMMSQTQSQSQYGGNGPSRPSAFGATYGDSFGSDAWDKEGAGLMGEEIDPQGRGAARLAQRRNKEVGAMGGGVAAAEGLSSNKGMSGGRKKWLWGSLVALVLVGLGVGLGVGLTVGKSGNKGTGGNHAAGSNANSTTTTTTGTNGTNSGDPSVFTKDSRLHNSFYAFAYTPQNVLLPSCGASQANVTRDIQLLSQLTNKIRLYGANCNQTALVLQAIQDTKVDMSIYAAVYVDSNTAAYADQVKAVKEALKTYGTNHVLGITVGNEYILNQQTAGNTAAIATAAILSHIKEMNSTVRGWGLDKVLPIGTSDAGSLMSATLARGIDYFHANVHPWFGTVGIDGAAAWTANFFQEFDVDVANSVANPPHCAIAETGWPTKSMTAADGNNGVTGTQGDASIANLQTFLDTFVCQANRNGTDYFFFEAFDEPWKAQYGGVEPYWGLFDSDRNLKSGITIPECSHT